MCIAPLGATAELLTAQGDRSVSVGKSPHCLARANYPIVIYYYPKPNKGLIGATGAISFRSNLLFCSPFGGYRGCEGATNRTTPTHLGKARAKLLSLRLLTDSTGLTDSHATNRSTTLSPSGKGRCPFAKGQLGATHPILLGQKRPSPSALSTEGPPYARSARREPGHPPTQARRAAPRPRQNKVVPRHA